jgi:fructosamine-3-kinase
VSPALRLSTGRTTYFLKWNDDPIHGAFEREVFGLELLRSTGTVRVPVVLAATNASAELPGFLLQEWLAPPSTAQFIRRVGDRLGAKVAELHRAATLLGSPILGYRRDLNGSRDGLTDEAWETDWSRAYAQSFLQPEVDRAEREGRLPPERRRRLERLLGRLESLLGRVERQPSLLHGDLWKNNVLCDRSGDLVLIDPHPMLGDRELELAYTEWAGGFPPAFYAAYEAVWPTTPGRTERRDLYLIWYMLRNLNDGQPQRAVALDGMLRWYVGAG